MGYSHDGFYIPPPEATAEIEEQSHRNSKWPLAGVVGGLALTVGSFVMLSADRSDESAEPYRIKGPGISINIEDRGDIPFLIAGAAGIVISGLSAEVLLGRKED